MSALYSTKVTATGGRSGRIASDDGLLYALSSETGQVLWTHRGGPRADMLLGNNRMISRWPARGGPVLVDDVIYFGAGIWPSEGIFLYALDPRTGEVLWCNDSSGTITMDQPHATARAKSGISARTEGILKQDKPMKTKQIIALATVPPKKTIGMEMV